MTRGGITGPMLSFALPLILGNMLQTLYNAADSVIVGRFIGPDALAAVGSAYSLMTFLTSLMIGLSMGAGVSFSYFFGAGDRKNLRSSLGVSFMLIGVITVIITVLSFILLDWILSVLSVPGQIVPLMREYLLVIFTGLPALFLFNFYASAERAIGNSRIALVFMAVSAVMNIVLDLYFVISLDWGIWGAALATVISQYAAGTGIMLYTIRSAKLLSFSFRDMRPERKMLGELASLSVLTSLQQSIMNLGILMVQGLVNSFGAGTMAAFAAGVKIDSIAYMPLQEFGNAFSTFVSQNMGADRFDRVRKGMVRAFLTALIFGVAVSVIVFIIPERLMTIFVNPSETEIIATGRSYLRIEGSFYALIGFLFLFYGIFRALKHPAVSLILTVISLGLRVLLAYIMAGIIGEEGIWMSIPIGWAIADMAGLAFYLMFRRKHAS